jgi:chemotaxis protein methyltransferase CheR
MPELHSKLALNPLRIWSAAASSGEEVYSLYLLASSLGIKTECIATDINTSVLQKGAEGKYKPNSVKAVDGAKFHYLLAPYMNFEKEVTFPPELTSKIERYQVNLSKSESIFPKNIHLVFIRNVFVYFTPEMRKAILQKIYVR